MSTQRTPPPVQDNDASPLFKHASSPDLSHKENSDNPCGRKRKQNPDLEELSCLRADLKNMFANLKKDQDLKFKKLNEAIDGMKTHNEEILRSNKKMEQVLEQTSKLYEDLRNTVAKISAEHDEAIQKIASLEEQLEQVQRSQLITSLEISNLPKEDNESLYHVLDKIHSSLGLNTKKDDIVDIHRVNSIKKKPVIVQYRSTRSRNDVIKAIRKYNKSHQRRYCANDVNIDWKDDQLYFSESLTANARKLHFLARNLQRGQGYAFCWISSGRVFIRKSEGSPAILIKSADQVENLMMEERNIKE